MKLLNNRYEKITLRNNPLRKSMDYRGISFSTYINEAPLDITFQVLVVCKIFLNNIAL